MIPHQISIALQSFHWNILYLGGGGGEKTNKKQKPEVCSEKSFVVFCFAVLFFLKPMEEGNHGYSTFYLVSDKIPYLSRMLRSRFSSECRIAELLSRARQMHGADRECHLRAKVW